MTTEGIEGVHLETHNWGTAAGFFQALGFEVEFSSGDGSGVLRNGSGPYLVLSEVPESHELHVEVILKVADADSFSPGPGVEVVTPFQETHYGAREMKLRDPDGRVWSVQGPLRKD
jgi:hypothetical protein